MPELIHAINGVRTLQRKRERLAKHATFQDAPEWLRSKTPDDVRHYLREAGNDPETMKKILLDIAQAIVILRDAGKLSHEEDETHG